MEKAGNSNFRVELLPGVNHFMAATESTCIKDHMRTFKQVMKDQGYGSLDEALAHTPLSAWPYTLEYLDLIEEWLTGLQP